MGPIAAIYTAVLSIYVADKEFERWQNHSARRHPGEIYVVLWTIIIISIFILDLLLDKPYVMPTEIISTYIVVLGILAITKKSKDVYLDNKSAGKLFDTKK